MNDDDDVDGSAKTTKGNMKSDNDASDWHTERKITERLTGSMSQMAIKVVCERAAVLGVFFYPSHAIAPKRAPKFTFVCVFSFLLGRNFRIFSRKPLFRQSSPKYRIVRGTKTFFLPGARMSQNLRQKNAFLSHIVWICTSMFNESRASELDGLKLAYWISCAH